VADGPVYLVCDRCGFFYGDVRLYPEQTVECPECGSEAAWAFPKLDKALGYQAQVRQKAALCKCCGITFEVGDDSD
jgi:anaerobic ribonucleoside-triphosphate reductase